MSAHQAYAANRKKTNTVRVVVHLPPLLVENVDVWGAQNRMTSRRETVEYLLRAGLERDAQVRVALGLEKPA